MRANRKRRCNSGPAYSFVILPTVIICAIISFWFGGKLFITGRCSELGKSIRALENEQIILKKSLEKEQNSWATMTKPEQIELALNRHGIFMENSQNDKLIVSLNAPVQDRGGRKAQTAYARNK